MRSSVSVRPKFNESPHESIQLLLAYIMHAMSAFFFSGLDSVSNFCSDDFSIRYQRCSHLDLACGPSYRLKIVIVFQTDFDETKMWAPKCSIGIEMALNVGQTQQTLSSSNQPIR